MQAKHFFPVIAQVPQREFSGQKNTVAQLTINFSDNVWHHSTFYVLHRLSCLRTFLDQGSIVLIVHLSYATRIYHGQ